MKKLILLFFMIPFLSFADTSVGSMLNYLKIGLDSLGSMAYQSSNSINVVTGSFSKIYLELGSIPTNSPAMIPSIYRNVIDSSTIVTVTQDQVIYKFDVSVPNVISNDLSQLDIQGREASWELWVNYTTTNSLSTTWTNNIDWVEGQPDLTVTGQYKFAFSTVDKNVIRGKQVYPTLQRGFYPAGSASGSWVQWAAATNASAEFQLPLDSTLAIFKVRARGTSASPVYANIGYATLAEPASTVVAYTNFTFNSAAKWWYFAIKSSSYTPPNNNYIWGSVFRIDKYGLGQVDTTIFNVYYRLANELEIKAYNAGWRP